MSDWWSPPLFQKEKCQRKGSEIRRNDDDDDDDNSYKKFLVRIPANVSAVLIEVFRVSLQCVQANARINFMGTPCVSNIQHFIFQLMHCVKVYPHTVHSTHASQVTICSHNTDNVLYEHYVSTLNQVCNFS